MAYSDYEHCARCVADKEAGLPGPHVGYKGLYVGDNDVSPDIHIVCSKHLEERAFTRADLVKAVERARENADVETIREMYEVVGHKVHWHQDAAALVDEMFPKGGAL